MINKPKLAILAAMAVVGVPSLASAEYIRNIESLPLMMARRFYDAHMQKVQMRLAPTKWLGVRD